MTPFLGRRTLAVHRYYYMRFSVQVAINLETKFNSTRIWQENMKPHTHGVCKDLLIRSYMFSSEANSFQFLLNKTKEKVFCFVLFLIGIRLIKVKIERQQYSPYLWIQESVFSDSELKTSNEMWFSDSLCPTLPNPRGENRVNPTSSVARRTSP